MKKEEYSTGVYVVGVETETFKCGTVPVTVTRGRTWFGEVISQYKVDDFLDLFKKVDKNTRDVLAIFAHKNGEFIKKYSVFEYVKNGRLLETISDTD